jgi:hypothetical protein
MLASSGWMAKAIDRRKLASSAPGSLADRLIDALVWEPRGLTEDEIEIVEEAAAG